MESAGMPAQVPMELFVSDIHGEYETFSHVVRSACGGLERLIARVLPELPESDRADLAALVCYPREKRDSLLAARPDAQEWLDEASRCVHVLLDHLGSDANDAPDSAGKLPAHEAPTAEDGHATPGQLEQLCRAVQHAAVARLHVVGDVYDRGPSPDLVMDELAAFPSLDIQWGNHDILWMGAALGQRGCVANVVRICARYGNLSILEHIYGMDLAPLRQFTLQAYGDDPCVAFGCKGSPNLSPDELQASVKVQKAMAFIQFKVEAQLIEQNPSFGLEARNLLHCIDYEAGTVNLEGQVHPLVDAVFPTIDPADPYRLTPEEESVMQHLQAQFTGNQRLQRHMAVLLERGSLYRVCGNTLLFHACVPLNPDGTCKQVQLFGQTLAGRPLFDAVDSYVRAAFTETDPAKRTQGLDMLWYLWLGEGSPLFAKSKMATFELYLVADKACRTEAKNPFYALLEDDAVVDGLLEEFGMDPAASRIVCGHTPIKVKDGQSPIKCGGKVLIIDGGMSRAYQPTTGIGGFALAYDAQGAHLATLEPFAGRQAAIADGASIACTWQDV